MILSWSRGTKAGWTTLSCRLISQTGRSVEMIAADLGNKDDLARVEISFVLLMGYRHARHHASRRDGAAPESNADAMDAMIDLNVSALYQAHFAAVPGFVERGQGTIINIGLVVAINPERLNGVYGATKAFVLAFSQSLPARARREGHTRPSRAARRDGDGFLGSSPDCRCSNLPTAIVMTAEDMVDAALAGFDQGEFARRSPHCPRPAIGTASESARQAMFGKARMRFQRLAISANNFFVRARSAVTMPAASPWPPASSRERVRMSGFSTAGLDHIGSVLQDHVTKGSAPEESSAWSIAARRRMSFRRGKLSLEGPAPVKRDSIYRIASMTKAITAAAVMMLIEDGKLRLDDSVERSSCRNWKNSARVLKRLDGPDRRHRACETADHRG